MNKRALVLLTEAYGGYGGLSVFNRYFLQAMCDCRGLDQTIGVPRRFNKDPSQPLPINLMYMQNASKSKFYYVLNIIKILLFSKKIDFIICAHINLLPFSVLLAKMKKRKLTLIIHGVEAWAPSKRKINNYLIRHVNSVISVSNFTYNKFLTWAHYPAQQCYILPNTIELNKFTPGDVSEELKNKYNLADKKILLTVCRLDAEERYKGVDEVLEVLPEILAVDDSIIYLIIGDGSDLIRLKEKVGQLNLQSHVIFVGRVSDHEKINYLRLADVFIMAGRGEGFGIVYLEAMACGIPVIGSLLDASREVLQDGKLGDLVDPNCKNDLKKAILAGFKKPKGIVSPELMRYSYDNFKKNLNMIVYDILQRNPTA